MGRAVQRRSYTTATRESLMLFARKGSAPSICESRIEEPHFLDAGKYNVPYLQPQCRLVPLFGQPEDVLKYKDPNFKEINFLLQGMFLEYMYTFEGFFGICCESFSSSRQT